MKFKDWIMSEEKEIDRPYYRLVGGMYGSSGQFDDKPLDHSLAPGSYWTPRWESILYMMGTAMRMYQQSGDAMKKDKYWKCTVYKINKAIMTDPPKEHRWAHAYGVDAGEQILVKAISKPEVVEYEGKKLKDVMPNDSLFIQAAIDGIQIKPPIDYKRVGVEVVLKNKSHAYLVWDYDDRQIRVVVENKKEPWKYRILKTINSIQEWEHWEKTEFQSFVDEGSSQVDGFTYFFYDMENDARNGKRDAKRWIKDQSQFGAELKWVQDYHKQHPEHGPPPANAGDSYNGSFGYD